MRLLIASLSWFLAGSVCTLAADIELSAPVRVLGSPPRAQQPKNQSESRAVASGLLSQYRSAVRSDATGEPDSEPSALRFLLALPDQLLILRVSVTIDGEPFGTIREQRIDRLIAELNKPASRDKYSEDSSETTEPPDGEPATEATGEEVPEPESEPISLPSSAIDARLRRYATVIGRTPSRDEVRWLLKKWIDGPTLLLLDHNFQRFRASQAPVFHVLDRDMDGTVSAEEVEAAQETLQARDVNQNDIVEYTELADVADRPRRKSRTEPHALIPLLDASSVNKSLRRLAQRYPVNRFDANGNGDLEAKEITAVMNAAADVTVTVGFDSKDAKKSTTRITQLSAGLVDVQPWHRDAGPWITIPFGGTLVEFSAVQSAGLSGSDQISVGVVNDGYPLLPAIDPNEDGRLTIRELRSVDSHLKRFDVDNDGAISPQEIPSTVRISIGLGPTVHRHLADIRSVHPPVTAPRVALPIWFSEMDRNKDRDISPSEFLYGADNFKKLDTDSDGLISPQEAVDQAANEPNEPASRREDQKASS